MNEFAFVCENDQQRLQDKVNALAKDGYCITHSYGFPDHRSQTHCVWLSRWTAIPGPVEKQLYGKS